MTECCVYWLFDETCSVPENDGYVGVSTNLPQRLREHKSKDRRKWSGVEILFVGTRLECLEKEIGYRPFAGIGWNSNSGGTSRKMLAPETRAKLSQWQKGSKRPGHSKIMKEIHARRSPEEKARLAEMYGRLALGNKSRTGQNFSAQEREKHRARMIGNTIAIGNQNAVGAKRSQEFRDEVSRRMKGKQTRLGAKLSEETKAKIGAANRRRRAMRKQFDQSSPTIGG